MSLFHFLSKKSCVTLKIIFYIIKNVICFEQNIIFVFTGSDANFGIFNGKPCIFSNEKVY